VNHWYRQKDFPSGFWAPYQVELTCGTLIFVPEDVDELVVKIASTWWERVFGGRVAEPQECEVRLAAAAASASLDEQDHKASTALMESVRLGWDGCVKVLLELGASTNMIDKEGRSPLHHAVVARLSSSKASVLVQMLLQAQADPNVQDLDPDKDTKDREKHRTALHYCVVSDYLSAAKWLIKAAAEPNIMDAKRRTPLHLAIDEETSLEMVSLLLASRSDPNKGNLQIGLTSSCLVASRSGDSQLAVAKVGARPDVTFIGKDFMTPLRMAALHGKERVAPLLIKSGCDTSIRAGGKTTADFVPMNFALDEKRRKGLKGLILS